MALPPPQGKMTPTKEEQVLGLPAAESKCLTRMKERTEREELEVNGSEQVKDFFLVYT